MNKDLKVSESVLINADLARVWDGLTKPEIIKDYLFGTDTVTDWKPGSEIVFQGEYEGTSYRDHGVILENDFQKKISYSYWSGFSGLEDKPENYSIMTYTLEHKGEDKTEFTWTQSGYASEEAYNHSVMGMKDFMQKIKKVIEK